MDTAGNLYYRWDLALVHHLGFGFHADKCAAGILALLDPVREGDGLVVELGCGSGLLTHHLVEAGHRVLATDASPASRRDCAPSSELVGRPEGATAIRSLQPRRFGGILSAGRSRERGFLCAWSFPPADD